MTTLAPTLQAACEAWAGRPAITYHGRTLSYAELWERVLALAAAYDRLGISPGDRIVCQLPNCPEHVIAMNAAWACGALHAGTDHDLTGPELGWLAAHTEAAALVFQPRDASPDPFAPLSAVRVARPQAHLVVNHPVAPDHPHHSLAALLAAGDLPDRAPSPPGRDDPALLLLTSGTTGRPKGIPESLAACWAKMQFFADALSPCPDDVHLLYLPMGHVFGLRLALLALLSGGRLVLLDRFSPEVALRAVSDERVSVLPGMPAHFRLLLGALDPAAHDVSSLRWGISAAAALSSPLAEAIYQRLGVDLLFVYGCSEGFTMLTTDRQEICRGSVGSTVFRGPQGTAPNGSVAILHPESHRPLPVGEVGEIAFGASQPVRYWRAADAAADGWYHTGDLGRMDPAGCVYIVGRLKELVNRGGLKVAPSEVEVALASHPEVADAGVVATPDAVLGEAICACVVPTGPTPPDLAGLRRFLGASLARHKLPDELCLLEHIPRTKIGKVDRQSLAALALDPGRPRERLRPG